MINISKNMDNEEFRYERKFLILSKDVSKDKIKMLINLHPACFSKLYSSRYVNNLYFDTSNYKNFHENIEGVSDRQKVRIRWYGNFYGEVLDPVLEIKIKKSAVGTKKSFVLNPFTIDSNFNWKTLNDIIYSSDIQENVKEMIKSLKPVIFNRYRREYFGSRDQKFRMTLDDRLEFFLAERAFNFDSMPSKKSSNYILELKYNKKYDDEVSNISSFLPFRMTKSSKYVTAVEKFYKSK